MNTTLILTSLLLVLSLLLLIAIFFGIQLSKLYFKLSTKQIQESTNHLNKQIINSVQTKFIEISPSTQSLVEAAIEVWRLEKRTLKVSKDLSEDQNKAFENSITKLKRFLDKNDITFTDYTDQKYNEGLNLDVLSIDKDGNVPESVIKETHEPAVFHKGQLIKKAKVVVLEKS